MLSVRRAKQIPKEFFVGGIDDIPRTAGEIGQIKSVPLEGHNARIGLAGLDRLHAAAVQKEESAGLVLHHFAALREDGGVLLGIAPVVDENTEQNAVRLPAGDMKGQPPPIGVKRPGCAMWVRMSVRTSVTRFLSSRSASGER